MSRLLTWETEVIVALTIELDNIGEGAFDEEGSELMCDTLNLRCLCVHLHQGNGLHRSQAHERR